MERCRPPVGPYRGPRPSAAWTPVGHGVHRPREVGSGLPEDAAAWALVLPPGGCFTHLTAAALRGWWLPPLPSALPMFAAAPTTSNRVRRSGLMVSRHPDPVAWIELHGLRVATAAETLLACARDLGVLDMIVLTDSALRAGDCQTADLRELLATRRRGVRVLRRAMDLADGRSESPFESLLRVLHVVCGVPVEPQRVVRDADDVFVARGDLHLLGSRTIHEYDGADHRDRTVHRRDLARDRRLANAGWVRRGYTDREVLSQASLILRDADHALGRPHRPARVRAWHRLLRESMFTPEGRAAGTPRLAFGPPGARSGQMS